MFTLSPLFLQFDRTPLHWAAWEGHATIVQTLVEDPRVCPGEKDKVEAQFGQ